MYCDDDEVAPLGRLKSSDMEERDEVVFSGAKLSEDKDQRWLCTALKMPDIPWANVGDDAR